LRLSYAFPGGVINEKNFFKVVKHTTTQNHSENGAPVEKICSMTFAFPIFPSDYLYDFTIYLAS